MVGSKTKFLQYDEKIPLDIVRGGDEDFVKVVNETYYVNLYLCNLFNVLDALGTTDEGILCMLNPCFGIAFKISLRCKF